MLAVLQAVMTPQARLGLWHHLLQSPACLVLKVSKSCHVSKSSPLGQFLVLVWKNCLCLHLHLAVHGPESPLWRMSSMPGGEQGRGAQRARVVPSLHLRFKIRAQDWCISWSWRRGPTGRRRGGHPGCQWELEEGDCYLGPLHFCMSIDVVCVHRVSSADSTTTHLEVYVGLVPLCFGPRRF